MPRAWKKFKSFWTAEEVPRWFGLSLVLVYVIGLGGVAYTGINAVCEEANQHLDRADRYAILLLAERLSNVAAAEPREETARRYQRELNEFVVHVPVRYVRVMDRERQILASSHAADVGATASDDAPGFRFPTGLETRLLPCSAGQTPDRLLRVPMGVPLDRVADYSIAKQPQVQPVAAMQSGLTESGVATVMLEARLPPSLEASSSLAGQMNMAIIILVVMGALFVLYRCLRGQLRSASLIAERLQSHQGNIQENLAELRLADAVDGVTGTWNQLVDLTRNLSNTVQQATANDELSRALMRTSGGALAEALNAVPDGVVHIADEIRFEYVNAAAYRLLGWNSADAKRMTLRDARAEGIGAKILEILRAALQPDGSFEARVEVVETDSSSSDASSYRLCVFPLQRVHHNGECVVVIRDVSQQMRADRAREEFITQVTHELRTPLTNIRAYADTLSSGMFEDPKVITECYNVITKETRRLSRLIEDILSVSQLEVGSIDLHLDNVDLKTLLGEGVRDVRGLADEKNIDIQVILPAKLEPIRGDRDKLAVVVNNLLGNAIKYTPPNGSIIVGCQVTGEAVGLTFKDNGIGVDPADHARVFEKFQRANDPAVQAETGTGIGLYTAREIVRRHGGDIEIISEKGAGSTFVVRLPHKETRAGAMTTSGEA